MKVRTWRKAHRYLGFIIGIQLFLWTTSGLVFSWNSIDRVRGEHLARPPQHIDLRTAKLKNLNAILDPENLNEFHDQPVIRITLKSILEQPVFEVTFDGADAENVALFDAVSGHCLSPIDREMAAKIALNDFAADATVKSIEMIESVGPHSEYRGKELPAWRVVLDHPAKTSIYVSANRGAVTSRRNNQWRLFDFFWMLHTMDYQGRDNFNSWLLRGMSVFGVITVLSGFGLGLVTTGWIRKPGNKSKRNRRQDAVQLPNAAGD